MKKFLKTCCLLLVLVILLAVPVTADEATTYASAFFNRYCTYLYRTSGTTFQIWFEVDGKGTMDEIGVNKIVVERSIAGGAWTAVKTYTPSSYPNMICTNTGSHMDCVEYVGLGGCDYRAYVTFYASNSSGFGERSFYAYFI